MECAERNAAMSKEICPAQICTACGACENICPKNCVVRTRQASSFSMTKGKECISCGLCEKVCPMRNPAEFHPPLEAKASWASDEKIRWYSASGGIAASLYRYAMESGYKFIGASLDESFECHLTLGTGEEDICKFRNSKYTYSFPDRIYKQVAEEVKRGFGVLFIGLPCQVSAIKNYFSVLRIPQDKLFLVDIICHGTPNPEYLKDHVAAVSQKLGKTLVNGFFRDAKFDTSNFAYTLYTHNSETPAYIKYVDEDDLYQIGYHNALIYRDSCYVCKFAQQNRTGDLTIGDFHVWDVDSCDIDTKNVSTVLVNTKKGKELLCAVAETQKLIVLDRPLDEPIRGEKQLRHPSVAGLEREVFLNRYMQTGNYEVAAQDAFRKIILKRKLHIDQVKAGAKQCIKLFIPRKLWLSVKKKYKK